MEIAPPPWNLTGNGYILLYKFPRAFGTANSPHGLYKGGFGSVMLVDYHSTNVGPYHELLFIPGCVAYPHRTGYSISKIYVSTMESVIGGQQNWGIPKEVAKFEWQPRPGKGDYIRVCPPESENPFFEIKLTPFGINFPVTSAILPPLAQFRDQKTYVTRLQSTAQGQLARIDDFKVTGADFPAIDRFKPIAVIKVTGFRMVFPIPVVIP
jgi:hypothetical protein